MVVGISIGKGLSSVVIFRSSQAPDSSCSIYALTFSKVIVTGRERFNNSGTILKPTFTPSMERRSGSLSVGGITDRPNRILFRENRSTLPNSTGRFTILVICSDTRGTSFWVINR